MKNASKLIILFSLLLIITIVFGCKKINRPIKLTIIFNDLGNIHKNSAIRKGDFKIGEVIDINQEGKNFHINAKIYKNFAKEITFGTKFYILPKTDYITVIVKNPNGEPIKNNTTIYGSPYPKYYENLLKDKLKNIISKGKEYFNSQEWKDLKKSMIKEMSDAFKNGGSEAEKAYKKFKESIEENAPEVKKKMETILDSLYNKYNK